MNKLIKIRDEKDTVKNNLYQKGKKDIGFCLLFKV